MHTMFLLWEQEPLWGWPPELGFFFFSSCKPLCGVWHEVLVPGSVRRLLKAGQALPQHGRTGGSNKNCWRRKTCTVGFVLGEEGEWESSILVSPGFCPCPFPCPEVGAVLLKAVFQGCLCYGRGRIINTAGEWDLMAVGKREKEDVGSRAAASMPGAMLTCLQPTAGLNHSPEIRQFCPTAGSGLLVAARASPRPCCESLLLARKELLGRGRVQPCRGAGGEERCLL